MSLTKWTEKNIQRALWMDRHRKGDLLSVPNCHLYGWEADFLSLTRARLLYEYEIKISRADFRADQRKEWKHGVCLSSAERAVRPNVFYYVTPPDLVPPEEVPDYAGLLYVTDARYGWLRLVRRAPRLHGDKISDAQLLKLAQSLSFRYWQQRYHDLS